MVNSKLGEEMTYDVINMSRTWGKKKSESDRNLTYDFPYTVWIL